LPKSTADTEHKIRLARTAEWQGQLDGFTSEALKPLLKATTQAQNEIAAKLDHWTQHPTPTGFSEDRALAMLDELSGLSNGIQAHLTGSIAEMAGHVGSASLATHGDILSWGGRMVPFNAVQMSVEQVRQLAINTPVGGRLLEDWVGRTFDENLVSGIKREIMTGMLKGEGYPDLVNRISDGWDMTRTEAVTLTRTYVQSANVGAQQAVYKANQDVVKGEVWVASLEIGGKKGGGTCLACAVLDGKEYLYPEQPPECPLHPRCRCVLLPLTKTWKELGIPIDEMEQVYRPYTQSDLDIHTGRGGAITTQGFHQGSFSDLFPTLPPEQQIAIVGPGRYGLIKDGVISFDDLVDKTTGQVRLLEKGPEGWIGLKPSRTIPGFGELDFSTLVEKRVESVGFNNFVDTLGSVKQPGIRGTPEIVQRLTADPILKEIAAWLPSDLTPVAAGREAVVLETKDGQIIRIGRVIGPRPDIPEVLQSTKQVVIGDWQVEILPKVDTNWKEFVNESVLQDMRQAVARRGFWLTDEDPINFGRLANGEIVLIDPGAIRGISDLSRYDWYLMAPKEEREAWLIFQREKALDRLSSETVLFGKIPTEIKSSTAVETQKMKRLIDDLPLSRAELKKLATEETVDLRDILAPGNYANVSDIKAELLRIGDPRFKGIEGSFNVVRYNGKLYGLSGTGFTSDRLVAAKMLGFTEMKVNVIDLDKIALKYAPSQAKKVTNIADIFKLADDFLKEKGLEIPTWRTEGGIAKAREIREALMDTPPRTLTPLRFAGFDKNPKFLNKIEQVLLPEIRSLVGSDLPSLSMVRYEKGVRAYASSQNKLICIGQDSNGSFWHEAGHHLEYSGKLERLSAKYRLSRTVDPDAPVEPLKKIVKRSNYGPEEVAFRTTFKKAYTGKVYDVGWGRAAPTEILSMGLQEFCDAQTMANFMREDPEFFRFMVGVFRGIKGGHL
jgi:hypothetical protein